MTEQGNPGIYVQIDEWLPLYKGNIYVVDEVTGRMYLAKGEHLMRIAETASHRPFQDQELSPDISLNGSILVKEAKNHPWDQGLK